jgi:cytochrome P450
MPDLSLAPALPGPFVPPRPMPPDREPPFFARLRALRTNVLTTWPRRAYEEPILEQPFLGHRSVLVNVPDAIRHVLVEAHDRYGRTPATIRLLRPLIGDGLLLSKGAAWRHQRRTLAPAFAPRAIAMLVPYMRNATAEALARLMRRALAANAKCLVHIASRIGGCGKICHKPISRNILNTLHKTPLAGSLVNKTG